MKRTFLGGTMTNSVIFDRTDFRIDADGHSFFEMVLAACEIPEQKWPTIQSITIDVSAYSDMEESSPDKS